MIIEPRANFVSSRSEWIWNFVHGVGLGSCVEEPVSIGDGRGIEKRLCAETVGNAPCELVDNWPVIFSGKSFGCEEPGKIGRMKEFLKNCFLSLRPS